MRKYLKPALEIEAFDVEDVITASSQGGVPSYEGAPAPIIDVIELN